MLHEILQCEKSLFPSYNDNAQISTSIKHKQYDLFIYKIMRRNTGFYVYGSVTERYKATELVVLVEWVTTSSMNAIGIISMASVKAALLVIFWLSLLSRGHPLLEILVKLLL